MVNDIYVKFERLDGDLTYHDYRAIMEQLTRFFAVLGKGEPDIVHRTSGILYGITSDEGLSSDTIERLAKEIDIKGVPSDSTFNNSSHLQTNFTEKKNNRHGGMFCWIDRHDNNKLTVWGEFGCNCIGCADDRNQHAHNMEALREFFKRDDLRYRMAILFGKGIRVKVDKYRLP